MNYFIMKKNKINYKILHKKEQKIIKVFILSFIFIFIYYLIKLLYLNCHYSQRPRSIMSHTIWVYRQFFWKKPSTSPLYLFSCIPIVFSKLYNICLKIILYRFPLHIALHYYTWHQIFDYIYYIMRASYTTLIYRVFNYNYIKSIMNIFMRFGFFGKLNVSTLWTANQFHDYFWGDHGFRSFNLDCLNVYFLRMNSRKFCRVSRYVWRLLRI